MGKGDSPRHVDAQKYRENYDRIFSAQRDADAALQRARRALNDLTKMAQEDGLYGPTEGT